MQKKGGACELLQKMVREVLAAVTLAPVLSKLVWNKSQEREDERAKEESSAPTLTPEGGSTARPREGMVQQQGHVTAAPCDLEQRGRCEVCSHRCLLWGLGGDCSSRSHLLGAPDSRVSRFWLLKGCVCLPPALLLMQQKTRRPGTEASAPPC